MMNWSINDKQIENKQNINANTASRLLKTPERFPSATGERLRRPRPERGHPSEKSLVSPREKIPCRQRRRRNKSCPDVPSGRSGQLWPIYLMFPLHTKERRCTRGSLLGTARPFSVGWGIPKKKKRGKERGKGQVRGRKFTYRISP